MAPNKPSYRSLIDAKIIKRTDNGMAIIPGAIRMRDGFNLRDVDAPDYRQDIEDLKAHLRRGGKVPALEVVLSDDGQGVDVVDGHRRTTAYLELIEAGDPIEYIRIEPFTGNMLDQVARVMTSQEGRKLTPLEVAAGYARLIAYNLTPDDIARRVGKTRQHVDQLLILASAPHEVQQMVRDGEVSATQAITTTRQHGNRATEQLKEAQAKAGGRKVTAKALKPWTPPAKVAGPLIASAEVLAGIVPKEVRASLFWMESEKRLDKETVDVKIPAELLWKLLNQCGDIDEARQAATQKARDKANQAAQSDLVGTDGA